MNEPLAAVPAPPRGTARDALKALLPYLWQFRGRIVFALTLMLVAKLANVGVPLVLQRLVDQLDVPPSLLLLPVSLLIAYGAARLSTTVFTELRQLVFARVMARVSPVHSRLHSRCPRRRSASRRCGSASSRRSCSTSCCARCRSGWRATSA